MLALVPGTLYVFNTMLKCGDGGNDVDLDQEGITLTASLFTLVKGSVSSSYSLHRTIIDVYRRGCG